MKYYLQGAPKDWPTGWNFPALPWPPGWPRSIVYENHIVASADELGGFVFQCVNEFDEDDDSLNGEMLFVRAYDGEKLIRLRPDMESPWYGGAFLKIGKILHGHCGAKANLYFDVQRMSGDVLMVIADVYGVTPRHGTGIPVKAEKLT